MDEFERSLYRDKLPEWSSRYIDYSGLQRHIDEAAAVEDKADQEKQKSAFQGVSCTPSCCAALNLATN